MSEKRRHSSLSALSPIQVFHLRRFKVKFVIILGMLISGSSVISVNCVPVLAQSYYLKTDWTFDIQSDLSSVAVKATTTIYPGSGETWSYSSLNFDDKTIRNFTATDAASGAPLLVETSQAGVWSNYTVNFPHGETDGYVFVAEFIDFSDLSRTSQLGLTLNWGWGGNSEPLPQTVSVLLPVGYEVESISSNGMAISHLECLDGRRVSTSFAGSAPSNGYFSWKVGLIQSSALPLPACQPKLASLYVDAPEGVPVSIDDAVEGVGSASVELAAGRHSVSVPETVELSNATKLRFVGWESPTSLGLSSSPLLQVYLPVGEVVKIAAVFDTQYELNLTTHYSTAEGSGWYDEGSLTMFYLAKTQSPMSGILGVLGGKLQFKGWYEEGALITDSPNGTIKMDKAHNLSASWQPDYSIPIEIGVLGAALILVPTVISLLHFKKKRSVPKRTRRTKIRKNAVLLGRLEQLHASGKIREDLYQKLKEEYEAN